jgi:hypothetical protein
MLVRGIKTIPEIPIIYDFLFFRKFLENMKSINYRRPGKLDM